MSQLSSSNTALLLFSFLMAIGIVWIKGQERIDRQNIHNVKIQIEKIPDNLMLPDEWIPPTATVSVQGPRNVIEWVSPSQSSFWVDLSTITLDPNSTVNVLLTNEMFRVVLPDPDDRSRISVIEESIIPRQVSLTMLPWDIDSPQPEIQQNPSDLNSVTVPLLRIQKEIPIVVPTRGNPGSGLKVSSIQYDPRSIVVTGKREAVDRIKAVTTTVIDLNYFLSDAEPYYHSLPDLKQEYAVSPVDPTIRGVTVSITLSKN